VSTRLAPTARKLGRALRDAWLMLGIALLMILVLEVCYRAQASGRRALRPTRSTGSIKSPYADSVWLPKYAAEYANTFQLRWKPYVYFRRPPFNGSMIQVDSLGHRRTIPGPQAATDTTHVFFFGGSTMWGSNLRDSATIASVTAQRLEQSAPPGMTFHVTNFGESGYVFTQGMLELQMQLRQGNIPDVVVFYDGINDVAAAAQRGEAGVPQNETNRSREFEFGRAIYGTETGVGSDWRAARAIGTAIAQRFQFVQRLTRSSSSTTDIPSGPGSGRRECLHEQRRHDRSVESRVRLSSAVCVAAGDSDDQQTAYGVRASAARRDRTR
jgi:lysophospholipase L1-like esterase